MQTQYTNLVELAQAVEDKRTSKRDLIASTTALAIVNGNLFVDGQGEFPIRDHAHNQIAARLGIPAAYYDRMRVDAPDLLATNVNRWFLDKPERRMVRTQDGSVRAFLSDRYQRIEHEQVFAAVVPVLQEIDGLQVRSLALTDSKFYLKATVPTIRGEVRKGDIVEAGIEISNSEIGTGALNVVPFAMRLVCLNGMKMPAGKFSARHVGARAEASEEVYAMLTDETLRADDNAILLKTRDVVRGTLREEGFAKLLGTMQDAAAQRIEGNPVEAVTVLAKQFGLREVEQGHVLRHLIEGGDLSRWGVVNAVTRTAQDVEGYDRSDELEGFGGKLLELSKRDWVEIAKAA